MQKLYIYIFFITAYQSPLPTKGEKKKEKHKKPNKYRKIHIKLRSIYRSVDIYEYLANNSKTHNIEKPIL